MVVVTPLKTNQWSPENSMLGKIYFPGTESWSLFWKGHESWLTRRCKFPGEFPRPPGSVTVLRAGLGSVCWHQVEFQVPNSPTLKSLVLNLNQKVTKMSLPHYTSKTCSKTKRSKFTKYIRASLWFCPVRLFLD